VIAREDIETLLRKAAACLERPFDRENEQMTPAVIEDLNGMADTIRAHTPQNDTPRHRSLIENVSAISASFHIDVRYEVFYDMYADQLSGFSGIWTFISWAGYAFTQVEKKLRVEWDGEWIEAVDLFVAVIYSKTLDGPHPLSDIQNLSLLRRWARKAICEFVNRREPHV
jgi:hypothetical protein